MGSAASGGGKRAGRTNERAPPGSADFNEYSFLLRHGLRRQTLRRACDLAARWGTPPHDVLIANGWISETSYHRALARRCRVDFVEAHESVSLAPARPDADPRECLRQGLLRQKLKGRAGLVLSPGQARPNAIRTMLEGRSAGSLSIATRETLRETVLGRFGASILRKAIHGLAARYPHECANGRMSQAQRVSLAALAAIIAVFAAIAPLETLRALAGAATAFFALVVCLRLAACIHLSMTLPLRLMRGRAGRLKDAELPVYTVFVPLFREANVAPGLIRALARLDYPAAKLDIKIILEACDPETFARIAALKLPGAFEIIVVPDAQPRTKPKALNYALQFARGEYAVIYDAEDRPDPEQLRKALAAFRAGPPNLACVQARLNFYNARENWLTRQFAIEYAALFDGLLPALQALGLPIPLGGTSNHFRMPALQWLGAWDAFNVTEDADLGMRLYRRGYVCRMLDSTTLEEATCRFVPWLRQRSRWLKGFMQTWLVHMRKPLRLWRELGTARFLGFQVIVGGMIFSALIHPWFYVLVTLEALNGGLLAPPGSLLGVHIWLLALFNVALGYIASMTLALLALRWRGAKLAPHILFMPLYWLLISLAAYRALYQLMRAPFHWEKTEHGLSAVSPQSPSPEDGPAREEGSATLSRRAATLA